MFSSGHGKLLLLLFFSISLSFFPISFLQISIVIFCLCFSCHSLLSFNCFVAMLVAAKISELKPLDLRIKWKKTQTSYLISTKNDYQIFLVAFCACAWQRIPHRWKQVNNSNINTLRCKGINWRGGNIGRVYNVHRKRLEKTVAASEFILLWVAVNFVYKQFKINVILSVQI